MVPRLWLLPLSAALLTGCGGGVVIGGIGSVDCDREMAALTGRLGFPEQVEQRVEQGLHIHTFLYIRTGVAVAFTWGSDFACQEREFRLDPPALRAS